MPSRGKTINTELSKKVAKSIKSKPGACFWNAALNVLIWDNAEYVIGYVQLRESNLLFAHAWIETNNSIVDPTLILEEEYNLEDFRFFPVLRFDRSKTQKEILRNGGHPALQNLPHYAEKMLSIRDEIKQIMDKRLRFWGTFEEAIHDILNLGLPTI